MEILENVPLGPLTTLKIGGPARYFAKVTREEDLVAAVAFASNRALPMFVLGGGSNLVVRDEGFAGMVVQVAIGGPMFSDARRDSAKIHYHVPAGTDWNDFVAQTCEEGLAGLECLAGIPGSVGGSPVQNIGAYGQEVAQTIHSVHAFDREANHFTTLSAGQCEFGYRRSIFNTTQRDRYIVTRVAFEFDTEATPTLNYAELKQHFEGEPTPTPMQVYKAVRAIRDRKGMLIDIESNGPDSRSAGSFFKNPVIAPELATSIAGAMGIAMDRMPHWEAPDGVKLSAAWLIEQAGFAKGFELGRVGISSKHTLALVNRTGDATCEELLILRDLIVGRVRARFGIDLEQEPVMLG